MIPIKWDNLNYCIAKNGQPMVKKAISVCDGVTLEFSMDDATIQSMMPREYWFPVYSAPVDSLKIDLIDGAWVFLCGFGKPNDPTGNLILFRIKTAGNFSRARLADVIVRISLTLAGFGIRYDKAMADTILGN